MHARTLWLVGAAVALLALAPACGGGGIGNGPPAPPPCDEACQDGVMMRSTREMTKLAYNLTLQGKPVGAHDETVPCPLGGTARVTGNATSNAIQGTTEVDLTFVFDACHYLQKDTTPEQNYDVTLTGTITEKGTLAVSPTTNTVVSLASDAVTWEGTVYQPPIPYRVDGCELRLAQDGGHVGGTLCGRTVGTTL